MSSSPVKVALAGATGELGAHILEQLLAANHPVVVLTRSSSDSSTKLPSSPLITVAKVDYSSASSITPHLKDVPVVISALGSFSIDQQAALIEAAIAAGVQRFIPSEFGSDTTNKHASQLPVYGGKVAVQNQLKQASASNPNFSYTLVLNQPFLDSGLSNGFIVNLPEHTANLFDGGDRPISVTRLNTIARCTVAILKHLEETKNRPVYIHDLVTSQNEIISFAKEIDGKPWQVQPLDTTKLREDAFAELKKSNPDIGTAMRGFLSSAVYADGWGGDFTGRADNKLLGVEEWTKQGLKDYIATYLK